MSHGKTCLKNRAKLVYLCLSAREREGGGRQSSLQIKRAKPSIPLRTLEKLISVTPFPSQVQTRTI